MPRPKIKIDIVGALRYSDSEGLLYSSGERVFNRVLNRRTNGQETIIWHEALPNTDDWPGLGKRFPPWRSEAPTVREQERPGLAAAIGRRLRRFAGFSISPPDPESLSRCNEAELEERKRAEKAYVKALHSDPAYRQAAAELFEKH
jgi:hypothetical protein